ncbi:hypothetical protein HK104_007627 [Borealophlyctis nickersoniae]|nr:hypothetical protein HK104_007627 [Borealophlyctis nickersoniae]
MPSIAIRMVDILETLLHILLRVTYWEALFPLILRVASENSTPSTPDHTDLLATVTVSSIHHCMESYYSRLYGMFPCNTMRFLRSFMGVKKKSFLHNVMDSGGSFELNEDPFKEARETVADMDIDEDEIVVNRLTALAEGHRLHPSIITSNAEAERADPNLAQKSPGRIVTECLELRVGFGGFGEEKIGDESTAAPEDQMKADLDSVMKLSRRLRRTMLSLKIPHEPASSSESRSITRPSTSDLMTLHLFLLLNEVNFESCMRRHHLQHIRKLKKLAMAEDLREADRQGVFEKLKNQTSDLAHLHKTLEQQRHEASLTRERHRRIEEDLSKRLKGAKEEIRGLKESLGKCTAALEACRGELDGLRRESEAKDARLSKLEIEMTVASTDLARLRECELTVEQLSKQIMDAAQNVPSVNEATDVPRLEVEIQDLEREVSELKQNLAQQQQKATTATSKTESLERTVSSLEKRVKEQTRTIELLRTTSDHRVKAVEEKYRTLRGINAQLQSTIVHLRTDLEESRVA